MRQPKIIPSTPGRYYWTEWAAYVDVYQRGKYLYTTVPGGLKVRISHRIAGSFLDTNPKERKK